MGSGDEILLNETDKEKDLEIRIDKRLIISSNCEQIVKKANKILGMLGRNFTYILKYRRARGDLIQVYKYWHKINIAPEGMLPLHKGSATRGHSLKHAKQWCRTLL